MNYPYRAFFGSPVKQMILRFFSEKNPDAISVLDIAKDLQLNQSSVCRPLNQLEEYGMLQSQKKGKARLYTMKEQFVPIFKEVFKSLNEIQLALRERRASRRYYAKTTKEKIRI
jgi:DNA-binding IclR family transcriptional regulator